MTPDEHIAFRKYEKELDAHHLKHPIWQLPRGEVTFAVLAFRDIYQFQLCLSGTVPETAGQFQMLKSLQDGVSQALRWLCPGNNPCDVSFTNDLATFETAAQYVHLAAGYVHIADYHKMYGRGQISVDVNQSEKSVRFVFKERVGPNDPFELFYDNTREAIYRCDSHATEISEVDSMKLVEGVSYKIDSGRLLVESISPEVIEYCRKFSEMRFRMEILPLKAEEDVVGFTIGDFRQFFTAVLTLSWCAFFLRVRLAQNGLSNRSLSTPTQIVTRTEFREMVCRYSTLLPSKVDLILARLSYENSKLQDIFLTPFLTNASIVAWSPALMLEARPERNLLKLMCRENDVLRMCAENLIGLREGRLCQLIGDFFSKQGYQYCKNKPVKASGDDSEIDVLIYKTTYPEDVILIEAKAVLAPDEINEVSHATEEIRKGQAQLKTIIGILEEMDLETKRKKFPFVDWNRVKRYWPLVVSGDAEPNETLSHDFAPAIPFDILLYRIGRRHSASPKRLWDACSTRPWISRELGTESELQYSDLKFGDVTYSIPIRFFNYTEEAPFIQKKRNPSGMLGSSRRKGAH